MSPLLTGAVASAISGHLNTFTLTGSYDALATVTVPSGGASSITFSALPQTGYSHLQIRGINLTNGTDGADLGIRFNGDSGSNYSLHLLAGNCSSAFAGSAANTSYGLIGTQAGTTYAVASITDILDYANTNKAKTVRSLSGADENGSGRIGLYSGAWYNNSSSVYPSINSITLVTQTGSFNQNSQFSLYGIK